MSSEQNSNDYTRKEKDSENMNKGNIIMRSLFGIIMIIVYIGMGVLLMINFFGMEGDWAWTRYVVGVVLIIYGFWRGYRQYKGID